MATNTTVTATTIEIEGIDADWYLSKAVENGLGDFGDSGIRVRSITFVPGAASDALVVKNSKDGDGSDATEVYFKCAAVTDQRVKYYGDKGKTMWPFIDFNECTFSSGHKVLIEFA